jgi:hypothetical protein
MAVAVASALLLAINSWRLLLDVPVLLPSPPHLFLMPPPINLSPTL